MESKYYPSFCYATNPADMIFKTYFRLYIRDNITGPEIMNGTLENAYFHSAILKSGHLSYHWASCLTYAPQYRVPPGGQHNVMMSKEHLEKCVKSFNIFYFSTYSQACI